MHRIFYLAVAATVLLHGADLRAQGAHLQNPSTSGASLTVDTLRTSCGALEPGARQCAVDRLARRVRARLGLPDPLAWDPERSAFVSDDLTVPARVQYVESGREVTAVATFEAPRATDLPTGLATAAVVSAVPAPVPGAALVHPPSPPALDRNGSVNESLRSVTLPMVANANGVSQSDPDAAARLGEIDRAMAAVAGSPTLSLTTRGGAATAGAQQSVSAAARALARYVPPAMAAPRVPPPPKPTLIVRGPGPTVRVIIGREKPVALRFALADSIALRPGIDEIADGETPSGVNAAIRPVRITKGDCKTGWFSVLDVADTRVESDGTLTCYVRYGEGVTPDRVMKLGVTVEAGKRHLTRILTVTPVSAPTYGVRGGDGCETVAKRVRKMLVDRGIPVVSFGAAHRRADLVHCERFDRILPVAKGALNPAGVYMTGEITEAGVSVFSDAAAVGPIELWTTKPAGDPTNELAEAVVARLLKYTGL